MAKDYKITSQSINDFLNDTKVFDLKLAIPKGMMVV